MKQYDKNSLIGFLLMAVILIVFNTFFFNGDTINESQKITDDNVKNNSKPISNNDFDNSDNKKSKTNEENNFNDSLKIKNSLFYYANEETEILDSIENEKLKIIVSNKGGRIVSAILKEYSAYDGQKHLDLFLKNASNFNLQFFANYKGEILPYQTSNFYFQKTKNDNMLSMQLKENDSTYIEFIYKFSKNNPYLIDFEINMLGMNEVIPYDQNLLSLDWNMKTPNIEKSKTMQEQGTWLYYHLQGEDDVEYVKHDKTEIEEKNQISWVALKQQFFSAILISENGFDIGTKLTSTKNKNLENQNSDFIHDFAVNFRKTFNNKKQDRSNYQFYFGPNDYQQLKELKSYSKGFEEIIDLGYIGIDTWVNKKFIIPLFGFLNNNLGNYGFGLIIFLLTVLIKLILSPLTYKSYLSQAKMKVLKPEIDKLNEKNKGKDPMKVQQATMSLYKKAGVNPLGGCLPMLFQFPILIAMFRFFPSSIDLRQKSFLWADDLSSYDSVLDLGFNIPFYGDHVSLFTLMMTISTLLYTRMNSSMSSSQMPQMKWIMYLMPVMFLGFFNNYAAGLTYYYFLANMFTMTQQFLMKKFVDEKAILAKIEENKKKPPKPKSNFQKKLEEIQKRQEKKMRDRQKNKNKK
tara:strand:- start:92 stop:1987 length:1896 start_codon:yes stop_codon:yes gene_type:complete